MPRIAVSRSTITVDGRPALIQAGGVHYARLPSVDLWEPLLLRCRVAGLNAAFIPFPWGYHSPAPGFHDFTGQRDIDRLLAATERAGLWLIPHIGPWVGDALDGGGLPAWLHRSPDAPPLLAPIAEAQPSPRFLRLVAEWWEQLLPRLLAQPNLLAIALHPGITADDMPLTPYVRPLLEIARHAGVRCPLMLPASCVTPDLHTEETGDVMPWSVFGREALAGPVEGARPLSDDTDSIVLLDLRLPPRRTGTRSAEPARLARSEYPRSLVTWAVGKGGAAWIYDPIHVGMNWGRWAAPSQETRFGYGAPLGELATPTEAYRNLRRLALTVETLSTLLMSDPASLPADLGSYGLEDDRQWTAAPEAVLPTHPWASPVWADPPEALAWSRRTTGGAVAGLVERYGSDSVVQLALGDGGEDDIVVEDIPLSAGEVCLLPLDWALVEGRLISTTMEPILHTVVAGRELVILRNHAGGEVVLPSEFRPRHTRGPIYVERLASGADALALHFDPARIASVVLDGPDRHALQILVLEPEWAARVWPLDDAWRTTPAYPATWTPTEDAPARGVVIGPDLVIPEEDGAFRFLATDKGFGYRWGPWRGSDPQTWLSPFTWSGSPAIRLPSLTWESRIGSPEALPSYEDSTWRGLRPGSELTSEALGIDAGFIWYRAHYDGRASSVTLSCRHACDLFLNGEHIAAISPPPDYGSIAPKTLPLPDRHQREHNVLALLVEHQGREQACDAARSPHGLIAFELGENSVTAWRVRGGLNAEVQRQGFYGFADWSLIAAEAEVGEAGVNSAGAAVSWHRSLFNLDLPNEIEMPIFFVLDQTPTQCYVYLNGLLVGRIWYPRRSERRVWLPTGLLRRDRPNELLVAQWTRGASPGIGVAALEAAPPAIWRHESAV